MSTGATPKRVTRSQPWITAALAIGALVIAALLVWQGWTAQGSPDPTRPNTNGTSAVLDIAVLVFREGLECILVLTAITAGLMGTNQSYRKPIGLGVIAGFIATLITWFIAVNIVDALMESIPALAVQAATGLLAIVVLLIVMNWFFHKVYWTGWISFHNRKKKTLLEEAQQEGASKARLLWGLGLLGFASFYREGFEVVLFLQSYRMKMGGEIVLYGAVLGAIFAGIVAVLNFVGHHHLPYKKMLTVTGVMLAVVLLVMVGEEINEMQLAGWLGVTEIPWLQWLPSWTGMWFAVFPNWETIVAQVLSVVIVLGSYFAARYQALSLPRKRNLSPFRKRDTPPTENESALTAVGRGSTKRLAGRRM